MDVEDFLNNLKKFFKSWVVMLSLKKKFFLQINLNRGP